MVMCSSAALLAEGLDASTYYPEEGDLPVDYESAIEYGTDSTFSTVTDSNLTVGRDEYGDVNLSRESNASVIMDLVKIAEEKNLPSLQFYNSLAQQPEYEPFVGTDPDKLIEDYILQHDDNSTLSRGMKAVVNIQNTILAANRIPNGMVDCYITRKLVPSYMCPVVGKDSTYFGGDTKTDQEEAKEQCDDYCFESYSCVPVPTNENPIDTITTNYEMVEGYEFNFPVNSVLKTSHVDLHFEIPTQVDDNGTMVDFNLSDADYTVAYDATGVTFDGDVIEVAHAKKINLMDYSLNFRLFLDGVYRELRFKFYKPKKNNLDDQQLPIPSFVLLRGDIVYVDTNYYFCPETQFVTTSQECVGGELKYLVDHSGTPRTVCVNSDSGSSGPEREYGGFYEENTCAAGCFVDKECNPTYIHFDYLNEDSNFEVEVGCTDTDTSSSCTPELCTDLFFNSTDIVQEKNFINDDKYVYTIRSGARTSEHRPRIDVGAEMTGEDRDQVFINEMKDSAYEYMVKNQTFNYTARTIDQPTLIESTAEDEQLPGGGYKNRWVFKPSNIDYDGNTRYLYSVIKYEQYFKPIAGVYETSDFVSTTSDAVFKDISYAILLPGGEHKVFKVVWSAELRKAVLHTDPDLSDGVDNSFTSYEWIPSPSTAESFSKFYDPVGDQWVAYSMGEPAPYFASGPFNVLKHTFSYEVMPSSAYMADATPGLTVRSQKLVECNIYTDPNCDSGQLAERVYSGDYVLSERGAMIDYTIYSFYSDVPLTYGDLADYLIDDHRIYNYMNRTMYLGKIKDDASLGNNIEIYLQGEMHNMSSVMHVDPQNEEIGKKSFLFMFMY